MPQDPITEAVRRRYDPHLMRRYRKARQLVKKNEVRTYDERLSLLAAVIDPQDPRLKTA